MAAPQAAFGTTFKVTAGTAVAFVTAISGPGITADTIDVTHHTSTDGYPAAVQGLKDPGEVSLDLLFDPTETTHKNSASGLLALLESGAETSFTLTFADATTTWVFPGIVTGFEPSSPMDGAQTATCTIKVSGKPTLA